MPTRALYSCNKDSRRWVNGTWDDGTDPQVKFHEGSRLSPRARAVTGLLLYSMTLSRCPSELRGRHTSRTTKHHLSNPPSRTFLGVPVRDFQAQVEKKLCPIGSPTSDEQVALFANGCFLSRVEASRRHWIGIKPPFFPALTPLPTTTQNQSLLSSYPIP
ncbi:hypothetical protein PGT21_024106 [Puccinia graminis f. sp. tritici]|uniref:Uncharacterized protein n=1 Tax=Puccinia graminis f. sp. tritici TaxID=56615 RepID=A0A5B0M8D9_PUCGR|nr:hypothetical protein PGT21_024106 [Puccinia graminis f. sp. tritici]KAA1072656.1 hypothetical protein PGTUg99_010704 [Puccinia graminis f. sp. tritici]